jgi:hypothetical protein
MPPGLSDDGRKVFAMDLEEGLWVGGVDENTPSYKFEANGPWLLSAPNLPFAWRNDSSAVLGVKQEPGPPGFASSPLRPSLFLADGTEEQLPDLSHPNGPLDEIYWIGASGRALAAFGTRRVSTQTGRQSDRPTIALVDTLAGKILEFVEISMVPGLSGRDRIKAVGSRISKDGRVRILAALTNDKWLSWVEGEPPHIVPIELRTRGASFTLSPDGLNVLLMGNLSANGPICEFGNRCPDPTPVTGMVAELREISTGKLFWRIDGTAYQFNSDAAPAVSADGRYALISMPGHKATIALVEMATGKIVQQIGTLQHAGPQRLGFSPQSNIAWVVAGTLMATYQRTDR